MKKPDRQKVATFLLKVFRKVAQSLFSSPTAQNDVFTTGFYEKSDRQKVMVFLLKVFLKFAQSLFSSPTAQNDIGNYRIYFRSNNQKVIIFFAKYSQQLLKTLFCFGRGVFGVDSLGSLRKFLRDGHPGFVAATREYSRGVPSPRAIDQRLQTTNQLSLGLFLFRFFLLLKKNYFKSVF